MTQFYPSRGVERFGASLTVAAPGRADKKQDREDEHERDNEQNDE
jgi:hypothetical protein